MSRVFTRVLAASMTTLLTAVAGATDLIPRVYRAQAVGSGITRHYAPYFSAADESPSYATMKEIPATGGLSGQEKVVPVFAKTADGQHRVTIAIDPGTSLYGTGEVAGPLLRNGRSVTLWNHDAFGYQPDEPKHLYQSHPWVLAVRADGSAFGVLADTTWRTDINLDGKIEFTSEGTAYPVYIIDRASPKDVLKGLAELVGTMPLPPKWAIGYHQCRYSYNPESRVRELAKGFRDREIPCDVIWFDIDYMAGYRVFTFNPVEFPDPRALNRDLGTMGFHRIWMIDPGVKHSGKSDNDPTPEQLAAAGPGVTAEWKKQMDHFQSIRDSGDTLDAWVKTADGLVFQGGVWPGMCVFPDFTRPEVRAWWAGLYKDYMSYGVSGVWNDMNEPAVFATPTKTMPEDNVHRGGKESFGEVKPGPHARFHNVYGLMMAKGTYEGIAAANPDKRPFVLTRAGYIGSQRYAATWTGDNSATWNDLEQSIPMALNLGLSGQPFCGPDITGFNGNGPRDKNERATMMARWYGIGTLLGFSRGHTAKGNIDKEPWSFGPQAETTIRHALQRRYRLLPYLYTLFYEAHTTGLPVVRPAFFSDLTDPALRGEDDVFSLGDDLLVVPQLVPDNSRVVLEPKGDWKRVELVSEGDDRDLPVLKVRAGAIIPLGPVMQHTGEKPLDPLTLLVNLDQSGQASGVLYEDAGDGFEFTQGQYLQSTYAARRDGDRVTVRVSKSEGQMPRAQRQLIVRVLTGDCEGAEATGTDGEPISVTVP